MMIKEGRKDKITSGYAYHIKNEYFEKVNDQTLMMNKRNNSRPVYYCLKDKHTSLLWMIPLSSKIAKYQKIHDADVKKYGECLKLVIAKFGSGTSVFLLQNMFPVTEKYIAHIHKNGEMPVRLKKSFQKEIAEKFSKLRVLYSKGKGFIYTDIPKIEHIMLSEINDTREDRKTIVDDTTVI